MPVTARLAYRARIKEQHARIRETFARGGLTRKEVAQQFGVAQSTVSNIVRDLDLHKSRGRHIRKKDRLPEPPPEPRPPPLSKESRAGASRDPYRSVGDCSHCGQPVRPEFQSYEYGFAPLSHILCLWGRQPAQRPADGRRANACPRTSRKT